MFWRKQSKQSLDAEIIERARKNLRFYERWGRWAAAFRWASLIAWLGLLIAISTLVVEVGNNLVQQGNQLELWLGFLFGLLGGGMLHRLTQTVIETCKGNVSIEEDRLLVWYHDTLIECIGDVRRPAIQNTDSP